MNVVITIDELGMGGAQHIVYELVKHIDKTKYILTIICTDGRDDSSFLQQQMGDEQKNSNYNLIFLKEPLLSYIKTPFHLLNKIIRRLLRFPSDLFILPSLCRELKKANPDIVHAHQHGILAGYWTLLHKIPILATIHTDPSVTFYRECEKIIFGLLVIFRRIVLVGISKYNSELIKKHWRLEDSMVRYVNNGINIDEYYRKPHKYFTFINVSRQDKNKNQSLILKAFARLCSNNSSSSLKLLLVGGGGTHESLKKEALNLGINEFVEFTGYIENPKEHLAISDVYISSSHREGLSLSVLEAMASGLPIIATDSGGVRDLAQENGILIPDNDEDGLFEAMRKLENNEEMRYYMGSKSLEMIHEYSSHMMAMKYSCLYEELYNMV